MVACLGTILAVVWTFVYTSTEELSWFWRKVAVFQRLRPDLNSQSTLTAEMRMPLLAVYSKRLQALAKTRLEREN